MSNETETTAETPLRLNRLLRPRAGADAAALDAFEAYWQGMRRNGDVPRRSDIDPRGIESLLSNAFIVERIAPGLARLRIAGSHLSDLMGMEVRGMPLSAFIAPEHREQLANALVQVFDAPATVRIDLSVKARLGTPALRGTLLVMPLRSDLGDVSRALGCLVTEGTPGRGPQRFDIDTLAVRPLGNTAVLASRIAPVEAETQATPGFAAPSTPPLRPTERPYLRLVQDS